VRERQNASHCSSGRGPVWLAINAATLIDETWPARVGVAIVCDQMNTVVTAAAIAPIEKNSFSLISPCSQYQYANGARFLFQEFAVARRK
jgi:hypothetical protein